MEYLKLKLWNFLHRKSIPMHFTIEQRKNKGFIKMQIFIRKTKNKKVKIV